MSYFFFHWNYLRFLLGRGLKSAFNYLGSIKCYSNYLSHIGWVVFLKEAIHFILTFKCIYLELFIAFPSFDVCKFCWDIPWFTHDMNNVCRFSFSVSFGSNFSIIFVNQLYKRISSMLPLFLFLSVFSFIDFTSYLHYVLPSVGFRFILLFLDIYERAWVITLRLFIFCNVFI